MPNRARRRPRAPGVRLSEHILDGLRDALPVDVVFLCLHGAQMSAGIDDCEGAVVAAARADRRTGGAGRCTARSSRQRDVGRCARTPI